MSNWTAAELDDVLYAENGNSWNDTFEGSGLKFVDDDDTLTEDGWYYIQYEEVDLVHPDFGTIEAVSRWGGEGDGAVMGTVIKVTGNDGSERFFERTGRYSSWGADEGWSSLTEVEPYEKTVVRYRAL